VERNDLVQAGIVGLVNAARTYSRDSAAAFGLYARYRIRGEMLDTLRRLDVVSREVRRWQKQMEGAERRVAARLHRQPTEEEIAEELGVELLELWDRSLPLAHAATLAADSRGRQPEDQWPSRREAQPDSMWARKQSRELLSQAMRELPERYRKVIRLYYSGGMTMREIGALLSVNESRVCQIHRGALQAIARQLRASGICSSADLEG
jgi:RNA polymerase sigma factor for flagellar operon FliA